MWSLSICSIGHSLFFWLWPPLVFLASAPRLFFWLWPLFVFLALAPASFFRLWPLLVLLVLAPVCFIGRLFFGFPVRRRRNAPSARTAVGESRRVSCGIAPRLVVGVIGMRRSDASCNLSRSSLRRECCLVARQLIHVFTVLIVVHILVSSDLWKRGAR